MFKKILQKILRLMARAILWKYHPIVIGVTGSVGKTTTKEAIAAVLSIKYRVGTGIKNYNNEIGLPLSILGQESAGRSVFAWGNLAFNWFCDIIFTRPYPEVLVLEMGIDRPGDMEYLVSIVQPSIGVITGISSSHLEFFGSLRNIAKEKGKLAAGVPAEGIVIVNADDSYALAMLKKTKANGMSYGFHERSTLRAFQPDVIQHSDVIDGLHFKIDFQGNIIPIRLKYIIAKHHVYALLAALCVASALKVNLLEATKVIELFHAPKGRLQIIKGITQSFVLDDTYNASPVSVLSALTTLGELKGLRKVVVLGDMLELGPDEDSGHRRLAEPIKSIGAHEVYLVGKRMKFLADELTRLGYEEKKIHSFNDPMSAVESLISGIRPGDVLLVKGSQGMRMEKIVEKIIDPSQSAEKLLCRQEKNWKETAFQSQ